MMACYSHTYTSTTTPYLGVRVSETAAERRTESVARAHVHHPRIGLRPQHQPAAPADVAAVLVDGDADVVRPNETHTVAARDLRRASKL